MACRRGARYGREVGPCFAESEGYVAPHRKTIRAAFFYQSTVSNHSAKNDHAALMKRGDLMLPDLGYFDLYDLAQLIWMAVSLSRVSCCRLSFLLTRRARHGRGLMGGVP